MFSVFYESVMWWYVRVMTKLCDTVFSITPFNVGNYMTTKYAMDVIPKTHSLTFKLYSH